MSHALRSLLPAVLLVTLAARATAADEIRRADLRFAAATDEVPSLQRHVLPLLGRLGCNGRACHGSFQGQGGFRLSLFGYDFKSDHEALTAGDEPRVDLKEPGKSLMLQKPTLTIDHEGGKRFELGAWQHRLLLRWIEAGAPAVPEDAAEFVSLEIEPREILFNRDGDKAQLKVIAQWSDGTREDVTPLCRFRSNDESMAAVDAAGEVTNTGKGDTAVVAFYDNGVATVHVLRPVSELAGDKYPKVATPTKIDELVVAKLRKLGIVPSELCTDAEFLRRVSLDMTGTLPSAAEVSEFLADTSAAKRTKKIDELLNRPAYAAWWATRLCDMTGNNERTGPQGGEQSLNGVKSRQWYQWIHRRVQENVPYDKIIEGIVLARSRKPEQTYEEYCAEMGKYFRSENPADFAACETMPHFWIRRTVGSAEGKALSFAHAFLGVSLQCAQCHKHPFDQWTKQDFDQFTAFFGGIGYGNGDRKIASEMKAAVDLTGDEDSGTYKRTFVKLAQEGKLLPYKQLTVPAKKKTASSSKSKSSKLGRVITPKLLGGEEVVASDYDDPRQPLIDWMRQDDNPYFARSIVNRIWAGYFHSGLVDPTDDLNLANPPSNPALLDYLTEGFVKSGYDLKWLHREIATSQTYQRSYRPNNTNTTDERNFSRAVVRRLPAEVASDALLLATASDEERAAFDADPVNTRTIGITSGLGGKESNNYATMLFGKPPRAINCDCERSNEPSLLQTVYLRNDQDIWRRLANKSGWMAQVAKEKEFDQDRLIREAYLRTLSRLPVERETTIAREHFATAENPLDGLRGLVWALLNTKEFIVNH